MLETQAGGAELFVKSVQTLHQRIHLAQDTEQVGGTRVSPR